MTEDPRHKGCYRFKNCTECNKPFHKMTAFLVHDELVDNMCDKCVQEYSATINAEFDKYEENKRQEKVFQ